MSATIIGGAIGAAAGSFIPGVGWQLGWAIGTTLGSMFDTSQRRGFNLNSGLLADLHVSSSSYGTAYPSVWGQGRVGGIIIWATDLQPHTTSQSQGGGSGGGGGGTVTTTSYTVSLAVAYMRGTIMDTQGNFITRNPQVLRIWADDLIVYDSTNPTASTVSPTFYPGSETQTVDPTISAALSAQGGLTSPAYRGIAYFVLANMDLTPFSNRVPNFQVQCTTDAVTVGDCVSDVCRECGILAANISTAAATDTLTGMQITDISSGQDILNNVTANYFYDLPEVDGKITAIKRGGASAVTIPIADMGNYTDTDGGGRGGSQGDTRVEENRVPDPELPTAMALTYYSTNLVLQQNTQYDYRQDAVGSAHNMQSLTLNIALSDDQGRQLAARLIDTAWMEREKYKFSLPFKYLWLSCADPITIPIGSLGTLQRVRIISMEMGMPGEIRVEAVRDDDAVVTQTIPGATGPTINNPLVVVQTDFEAWSGFELRDVDQNDPGFYIVGRPLNNAPGWQGAQIQYSTDAGTTWINGGRLTAPGIFGAATTALADATNQYPNFDVTNTFNVSMHSGGQVASTPNADALNGGNAAVLGNEILGFGTATVIGTGLYTLSNLLRSERNSPGSGHTNSDLFILANAAIVRVPLTSHYIGQTVLVKAVSPGQDPATVTAQSIVIATPSPTKTALVQSQVDAMPPLPFFRVKGYINTTIASGTSIDHTWFDGANIPTGITVQAWTQWCHGPGGSLLVDMDSISWTWWLRYKIKNTTAASISIPYAVPFADDYMKVIQDGTTVVEYKSGATTSGTGNIAIAAGATSLIELILYNSATTPGGTQNPGHFNMLFEPFMNTGLSFVDAGP